MAKKRWQPYHWVIPLTEGEVPMDKGGFRTSGYSALEAVVYCKDCRHFIKTANDAVGHCTKDISCWIFRNDDWFCADGEKRQEDG